MSNDELEIMNCGVEPFLDLGIGLKRGLDSMLVDSGMIGMIGKELKGGLTDRSMVGQGLKRGLSNSGLVSVSLATVGHNLTSSGLCDSSKTTSPGLSTKWTAFSKDVVGTEGVRTILVLRVPNTASACVSSDTKS